MTVLIGQRTCLASFQSYLRTKALNYFLELCFVFIFSWKQLKGTKSNRKITVEYIKVGMGKAEYRKTKQKKHTTAK